MGPILEADIDTNCFKAIPAAVRQPIKLPKHAAHILDSRIDTDCERDKDETGEQARKSWFMGINIISKLFPPSRREDLRSPPPRHLLPAKWKAF